MPPPNARRCALICGLFAGSDEERAARSAEGCPIRRSLSSAPGTFGFMAVDELKRSRARISRDTGVCRGQLDRALRSPSTRARDERGAHSAQRACALVVLASARGRARVVDGPVCSITAKRKVVDEHSRVQSHCGNG